MDRTRIGTDLAWIMEVKRSLPVFARAQTSCSAPGGWPPPCFPSPSYSRASSRPQLPGLTGQKEARLPTIVTSLGTWTFTFGGDQNRNSSDMLLAWSRHDGWRLSRQLHVLQTIFRYHLQDLHPLTQSNTQVGQLLNLEC